MKNINTRICPNCGSQNFKTWNELTDDERILVERLPSSADFSLEERKGNRWCARCFFELNEPFSADV